MNTSSKPRYRPLPFGLVILHEDRDLLVVDKPAGLLTVATDKESARTAYFVLTDYVRKGVAKSRNRVFIVHRLDRETSGLLVFAKSEAAKRTLQDDWESTRKRYLAVVHGRMEKDAGTIENYLAESGPDKVYATADPRNGKLARTDYRTLKRTKAMSLLEVEIPTGRKHQIRVHLAGIGHPIAGDKKYGKPGDTAKRLALHARTLAFNHPHSGKPVAFEAPVPEVFTTLVGDFA
jgi:tRNA pseudouridine32 synthase/23S rRNA pseudouridine746 synthase/23S rRNA pseudouridine1911/1915/1917 synthase